jgi:hypothetical protein
MRRFTDVTDLDSGERLYALEHEVRALSHPLFGRPMINRNAAQTNNNYAPGHDAQAWTSNAIHKS